MLKELIKEALCSTEVQKLLKHDHVACDQLLPAVQAALQQHPFYTDCLDQITDRSIQGCSADINKVQTHRHSGGAAFKLGNYAEALRHYTEALRWLDETSTSGSVTASQLHSNRSLCLLRLTPPNQTLAFQEADAAVTADPTSYKALYRRATAGIAIRNLPAAETDISAALQTIHDATTASQQGGGQVASQEMMKARQDFQALLQQIQAAQTKGSGQAVNGVADATKTRGGCVMDSDSKAASTRTNATDMVGMQQHSIAISHTEEAGRQLVVARDMPAPCDVWIERPAAGVLAKSQRPHRCWRCMQPIPHVQEGLRLPVYCKHCPMVQYCSTRCRDEDPFHSPRGPECAVAWARVLPEHALLAIRLIRARTHHTQSPPCSYMPVAPTTCTANNDGAVSGQDTSTDNVEKRNLLSDLMTHQSELRPSETALEYCVLAMIASDAYNRCAGESQPKKITVDEALWDMLRVEVNGIALRPWSSKGHDRWGLAIYPVLSCANHSCRPNMTLRFDGNRVTARLTCPALTGTPLTISYGPQVGESLVAERQQYLQKHYFFRCSCTNCAEPTDQEVLWGRYRCTLACPNQGCPGGWQLSFHSEVTCSCRNKEQLYHPSDQLCRCDVCGCQIQQDMQLKTKQQLLLAQRCIQDTEQIYEQALAALKHACSTTQTCSVGKEEEGGDGRFLSCVMETAELYTTTLEIVQPVLHHANLQLGQISHTAAQALSKLLLHTRQHVTSPSGIAQQGVVDSRIQSDGLELAKQVVQLYEISLGVLQLHYPPGSIQLANEQTNLANSSLILDSLLELGSRSSAPGDKVKTATMETLGHKQEANRLNKLAASILRLHFGDDVES